MSSTRRQDLWGLQNQDDVLGRDSYDAYSQDSSDSESEEQEQQRRLHSDKEHYDDELDEDESPSNIPRTSNPKFRILGFLALAVTLLLVVGAGLSDFILYSPLSSKPASHPSEPSSMLDMPMDKVIQTALPIKTTSTFTRSMPTLMSTHSVSVVTSSVSALRSTSTLTGMPAPSSRPTATSVQDKYLLRSDWNFSAIRTRREYNWTVRDTVHNPDGVYRSMMLINNEYPGPLIEANEGDTIVIHVSNQATNATSFHWHGIFQNGTNWMDGTVGITQCPIAPGGRFTYEFTVDNQSGTYWYHAHQGVQSSDGLYGPLIIHSQKEQDLQRLEYSTDRVVMLSDFYHDPSNLLLLDYLASDAENSEPVPDGALINGQAIRDCSRLPHRKCDNTTVNVGMPNFDLEAGKNHRLRILNVGAFAEFQLSLDDHDFAVTEVDGTNVLPAYYHRMSIQPAQRYSIIVSNNNTSPESYWLRAKMLKYCFAEPNPELEAEIWAVVNFASSNATVTKPGRPSPPLPTSTDWPEPIQLECRDMNTTELVPTPAISAPQRADATFHLRSNFEIGAWRLSRGFFNSSSFRPNVTHPTLHRAVDGLNSPHADIAAAWSWNVTGTRNTTTPSSPSPFDFNPSAFINTAAFSTPRELVVQTTGIRVIDLIITNYDDGSHPLHAHGYKFFVLASGHGRPPENLLSPSSSSSSSQVDLSNPLRRDTASIEAFSWLALRFVADNPGVWAFHCHVGWHAEAGLVMQFLTRSELVKNMVVPQGNKGLCTVPERELRKGMAPEDGFFMREEGDE